MTMRDAMYEALAGLGLGTDPAEVLAEFGFGDLPPDAVASALVHFAETADIELADALAPIVTRVSQVPYEEGDLPALDGDIPLSDPSDVFSLLNEIGLGGRDLSALVDEDADPDDYGDFDEVFEELSETVSAGEHLEPEESGSESTYGAGGDEDGDGHGLDGDEYGEHELGEQLGDLQGAGEEILSGVDETLGEELSTFSEFVEDELDADDYDDVDPSDLDLD